MAKITGPFLSLGASGQVGSTIVASKWKGQPYLRQYVIPSNPQSAAQSATRNVFTWANEVWKRAGPLWQAPWDLFAQGQIKTGRNAFMGSMVTNLRGDVDLTDIEFSPGAKGGLAATLMALTPAAGQITVDLTAPALPTGWAITRGVAVALPDQDPATGTEYVSVELDDASSPYSIILTGLAAGLTYVGGWFEYTKADGSVAYGPSLVDSATVT